MSNKVIDLKSFQASKNSVTEDGLIFKHVENDTHHFKAISISNGHKSEFKVFVLSESEFEGLDFDSSDISKNTSRNSNF